MKIPHSHSGQKINNFFGCFPSQTNKYVVQKGTKLQEREDVDEKIKQYRKSFIDSDEILFCVRQQQLKIFIEKE